MKTYPDIYAQLCSLENLESAFQKAKLGKSKKLYVLEFEANLKENLEQLQKELQLQTYMPQPLKRFIIRDPKTRVIHASAFLDRVVHHAITNVLGPIFEKKFVYDSYASRVNKGTHKAIQRFAQFMRKVSRNGAQVTQAATNNHIQGYVLKADIQHYFDTVDHEILIAILRKIVPDEKLINLVKKILNNLDMKISGKGMPLGNYTSQFFANVYLNELDYFVKHVLQCKYYIRYVDDFVILHSNKGILENYGVRIKEFLRAIKLELHPQKSKILPLKDGITFLGYKIFYCYRLLRRRNRFRFERRFKDYLQQCKDGELTYFEIVTKLQGWFGYAKWANTYRYRKLIFKRLNQEVLAQRIPQDSSHSSHVA
ncbi:MAG: reverse transcriptase domain-containing protein [Nanoarchaeota archaeon]